MILRSSFDVGQEGWCSYDYQTSVRAGRNIFILTDWQASGGVNDSGYIWSDQHVSSPDTPEDPISVFPFVIRRNWVGEGPIDLRNAEVSVYLRGYDLQAFGSRCVFWIESGFTSWHLESHPLEISDGEWASEPHVFTLKDDESLWHRTWSRDPNYVRSLPDALAVCRSYAIQLVDFKATPKGRLAMDELEIRLAR